MSLLLFIFLACQMPALGQFHINLLSRSTRSYQLSQTMITPPVVDVSWLNQNRGRDSTRVKVIAVSAGIPPKPDWRQFREQYYGKFRDLIQKEAGNLPKEFIPGSAYFDLSVAYFPGEFQRFSLYPPEIFREYIRLLGINDGDHVILYSRGVAAGMLFAARAWWTFKVYGHEQVSVLNGGLDAWKSAGCPVESSIVQSKEGNWTGAGTLDHSLLATFEELETKGADGKNLFEKLDTINFMDARPREQFTGEAPLGVPAPEATGSHIRGSKNLPIAEIMSPTGIKSPEEIRQAAALVGFNPSLPTITMCNTGTQASLLALGLATAGYKAKVFSGSITEVGARGSKYINEK